MTESIKMKQSGLKLAIVFIVVIIAGFLIVRTVVNERLSDLQLETKLLISQQETLLAAISETTARNGADEITEAIIKDCSLDERNQFDQLLGTLNNGLSYNQLVEVERLFGRCGNFFAERKSVMTSRLAREVEIYELFVNQLSNLSGEDEASVYKLSEWNDLSELELKQSSLFSNLVSAQDQIISALLEGNSIQSEEVQLILQSVNQIQETLIVTKSQADAVRSTLVSL